MARPDALAFTLSEEELHRVEEALATLAAVLLPRLKGLSAQDRRHLPRIGDKGASFVRKAYEYGQLYPDLNPSWLDTQAFGADLEAVKTLGALGRTLAPVVEGLADSRALAASAAYQAALEFYAHVKGAAKANVYGARAAADDLAHSFPGAGPRSRAPQAPSPIPPAN